MSSAKAFCKYTGRLQKNMSLNNMSFFLMKKCIELANSTFNLYVRYIKLAQNTKQFRSLVLKNFITVIHSSVARAGRK